MRLNPDRILGSLSESSGHGDRALWLVLRLVKAGGEAEWKRLVREYAEARGWDYETARKRLEDAYIKLKKLGLARKRRKRLWRSKPASVYVELTPSAKALFLHACE